MKTHMIAAAAALACFACGGSGNGNCEGSCASGSTRCLGNAVQTCSDSSDGGCPEWGADSICPAGTTCRDGQCTGACTDACALDERRCQGSGYQLCADHNTDGCLEWGGEAACGAGQSCTGGQCVPSCTDECSEAAQRCQGDAVQVCDDYDGDGCMQWGGDYLCAAGEACQYGICIEEGTSVFYVSPSGSDGWSGHFPEPNAEGTDGPLLTLAGARDAVRSLKASGPLEGAVRVLMRGGTYRIDQPVEFLPEDSGAPDTPVSYEAFPGEIPVISGGRPVTGWNVEGGRWTVTLPQVQSGEWSFAALWVDGMRRPRAATPNDGYYDTAGTADPPNQAFRFNPGDIQQWQNLEDVIVEVFHSWATSLHHVGSIDTAGGIVTFTGPAAWNFEYWGPAQRYRVENVFEALDEPGEWYLDRATGLLTYLPLDGEDPASAEVIAPASPKIIVLRGDPAAGQFVEQVSFSGLSFMHTDWQPGPAGASTGQAAIELEGAVDITGGRSITIEGCTIGHIGTYAVWFRTGTQDSRVVRTEMFDLGGGGVRIGEGADPATPNEEVARNKVDNCFIHDGGVILSAAVGVWIGRSSYNEVTHNEICDLDYTAVSVGWSWGYDASSAHHNTIADNHLHHIGRWVLSDMGGIYTLGISPGTELRHNKIHDIFSYSYGGWGLYNDEGSSQIVSMDNLVYNTRTGGYHLHYGEDNQVTNNILAFSHEGQIRRTREEDHNSFTFQRNIVIYNNGWLLDGSWTNGNFVMGYNLYWDIYYGTVLFGCMTLAQWQAAGHDAGSIAADPQLADPYGLDFSLGDGSPALGLGFIPFDLESFGLYGDPDWVALPGRITRPPDELPDPIPMSFSDGFESTPVGQQAQGPVTWGETAAATIRVTDEAAASGSHSLKFLDAPGLDYSWNPHIWYTPGIPSGTVEERFSARLGAGSILYHEWRDGQTPYRAGPSLFVSAGGALSASGVNLMTIPGDTWFTVQITYDVGLSASGLYDLEVTLPSTGTQTFPGLGTPGQTICGLRWLGFVSNADAVTVLYLDDISYQTL